MLCVSVERCVDVYWREKKRLLKDEEEKIL